MSDTSLLDYLQKKTYDKIQLELNDAATEGYSTTLIDGVMGVKMKEFLEDKGLIVEILESFTRISW